MSIARRVTYNTLVQVLGRVAGLAITLVTLNFVSNHLIVDGSALKGFGQYTIIFTYVSIVGAAADLGLFTLLVRELAGKSTKEAGELVGSGIAFRVTLMLMTMLVFGLMYAFLPYAPAVKTGILIGVIVAFSMLLSQVIATVFQANLLSGRLVLVETGGKLLIAVLTILVLLHGGGLITVVLANLAGNVLILILSYVLAEPLAEIRISFNFSLWGKMMPQFWSIALINVLALVHFKTDMLLLTFFKPETDVGIYGVAYKVLEVILIVPSIVSTNLLPVMSNFYISGREDDVSSIVKRSASLLFIVATFLAVYTVIFAPLIVTFVTSRQYLAAALPLEILAISILFVFLTTLLSQAIIATRSQKVMVRGYLLVIVLNILLNLYAIPRYSYIGAATTTVITEFVLLAFTVYVANQKFSHSVFSRSALQIIATALISGLILKSIFDRFLDSGNFVSRAHEGILLGMYFCITAVVYLIMLYLFSGASLRRWKEFFNIQ